LVVGSIGRLCDAKRPAYLVEAFAVLCRNWSRPLLPYLVVIGSGPKLRCLQRLASELGISGRVVWAGPVKGEDHVGAFDILGHTSSFEGFGYVFLEALASGVPIVSTRVGGVEELGIDGETGSVCDPWNAVNFAQLMKRLLCDDNLRQRLGERAIRTAERFDVERMVDATARLYAALTAHVRVPEGLGTAKVTTGQ
jgi:glycosyltransferase involved in cell wall biosynthesis